MCIRDREVLRLVKENKVYCIVVKDLSRFSRDYIDIQKYLEMIFPTLDVRVISIADKFDSNEYLGNPLEMAMKFKSCLLYTSLDKIALVQLFLMQQAQLKDIDHKLQLLLEQVAVMNNHRFGRSSEKLEICLLYTSRCV